MLYRIKISPKSSYISKLQSDTLFGAFCWSYRYLYGEERLKKMLESAWNGTPEIIFSNAFPEGTLPLPLGVYDEGRNIDLVTDKGERKRAYQQNKKYKKCHYLKREAFLNIQKGKWKGYSSSLTSDIETVMDSVHNMVPRGGSDDSSAGADGELFSIEEQFVYEGSYDVYILTDYNVDMLRKVLDLMFTLGIGAKKSVGKGNFKLLAVEEEHELTVLSQGNAFMALSNFIPEKDDPIDGKYKTLIKYGKLDRELSIEAQPFKKPLLFLEAGAVFKCGDKELKPYYGRCLHEVAVDPGISVGAYTIAIPMRLPD